MGSGVIYRAGFYSAGKHYFVIRPFLLDSQGRLRYSEPDTMHTRRLTLKKINHGLESDVKSGQTYTLRYLNRKGDWVDHATKNCKRDGELTVWKVPGGAFYFLYSPSDQHHLARIFLVNEEGEQQWY